jgi:putative endonuclease
VKATRTELARLGEDHARITLVGAGYRILACNLRLGRGELDLVARDGATLVFVEVKTRSGVGFGSPLEAITRAKQQALRRLAAAYLELHPHHGPVRFDCIGIIWGPVPTVEHIKDAF